MQSLCHMLLGFLFCPSVLLVKPFVHFRPAQLNLTEGETATFTCSISDPDFGGYLNWYQWGHDCQPAKLDPSSRKYSVSKRDNHTYQMEIREVEKNDTGTYYCWVNAIQLEVPFLKSNEGNLTVTEKVAAAQPPDEMTRVKETEDGDQKDAKTPFTDLRGTGVFLLLIVLYFSVWLIRRRRQKQKKQEHGSAPLEEELPAVTVFTVNYEMLEFPGGKKTRTPPSPQSVQGEQTEYATIVFLPKTPEAAEMGDLKQMPSLVCAQQP